MNRRTTAVALFAILIPSICFAWGREGHCIIGNIAAKLLTPQAAAAVKDLLGEKTLADVSMWADEIESDRAYKWASPLHYANVAPGHDRFDLQRDCPEKGCVVSAIIKYSHVLRDKTASRQERIEALKFLVHFVGDIHQPLHVSHARDKRGNDIEVTFFGERTNLHSVWDSGMIRRDNKDWSEIEDSALDRFAGWDSWPENATETELDEIISHRVAALVTPTPVVWAIESYKLAASNAYDVPKNGRIGQKYFDKNIRIVNDRLWVAGYRLAFLLNLILDHETMKEGMEECGQDFDSWLDGLIHAR